MNGRRYEGETMPPFMRTSSRGYWRGAKIGIVVLSKVLYSGWAPAFRSWRNRKDMDGCRRDPSIKGRFRHGYIWGCRCASASPETRAMAMILLSDLKPAEFPPGIGHGVTFIPPFYLSLLSSCPSFSFPFLSLPFFFFTFGLNFLPPRVVRFRLHPAALSFINFQPFLVRIAVLKYIFPRIFLSCSSSCSCTRNEF